MAPTIRFMLTLALVTILMQPAGEPLSAQEVGGNRETVLDRKVHIEEGVVLDVPQALSAVFLALAGVPAFTLYVRQILN